jgi:hypothetical protein
LARKTELKKPNVMNIDPQTSTEATGTKRPFLDLHLIKQTVSSLWIPEGLSEEGQHARIKSAIAMLQGIKPSDEIEGMLASQMVGTHSAAMECLRRAMLPNQSFEGREQNLKHGAKLLSIYARQIDALNKHRGKGQQKVTVEHVHVEAGGQAVVGNVEAHRPASQEPALEVAKAIAHKPGETLDFGTPAKALAKQRRR